MERKPVSSSNIKSVGYDPDTQKLHVEFHSGGVYEYDDVPPEKHNALMAAHSVGSHFFSHIRSVHPYTKL